MSYGMVRLTSGHVVCRTVLRSIMTHIITPRLIAHFVYLSLEMTLTEKKKNGSKTNCTKRWFLQI